MKKLIGVLSLLLILSGFANARDYGYLGIPESVTVTATALDLTWTEVLDSDLSCERFYLNNPDAALQITVTYNATDPLDDHIVIEPGTTIERNGNTPGGIYCGVTFPAGAVSVKVRYESWK